MITIKENSQIIKTFEGIDETLLAIIKDTDLKEKYKIYFQGNLIKYLDELLNYKHNKLIVSIYSENTPIFIDTVVKASDLLPSISWYNTIKELYFEKGYMYIRLNNMNILYKIRIVF